MPGNGIGYAHDALMSARDEEESKLSSSELSARADAYQKEANTLNNFDPAVKVASAIPGNIATAVGKFALPGSTLGEVALTAGITGALGIATGLLAYGEYYGIEDNAAYQAARLRRLAQLKLAKEIQEFNTPDTHIDTVAGHAAVINHGGIYVGKDLQIHTAYTPDEAALRNLSFKNKWSASTFNSPAAPDKGDPNDGKNHSGEKDAGDRSSPSHGEGDMCFTAETPILMADGTTKAISEIEVGDVVAAYHKRGPLEAGKVLRILISENKRVYDLSGFGVTPDHPFLTASEEFKLLDKIGKDERLVLADGTLTFVPEMRERPGLHRVYNFEVEGYHTYVAGGYRVHNRDLLPIVLDLSGNGINLTQLSQSDQFFDLVGDGYQHRTAWAGAGNGVLFIDVDGDGKISQPKEVIFTQWDPSAQNDMQALRNVFDTNHDGVLDANDAQFASFKVMVTNSDGTMTAKTLTELSITSINLMPDATKITLPDGSTIDGQTTFTMNGQTRTAAAVSFATDTNGYAFAPVTTTVTNADGSTTVDKIGRNADGSIANETITTTSFDNLSQTISFDLDGDGVVDKILTDVTALNGDQSRTETQTEKNGGGILLDSTAKTIGADGKLVSIYRDQIGGNFFTQSELHTIDTYGNSTITTSDLNADRSIKDQHISASSDKGQTQTDSYDNDGNGTFELTTVDAITAGASSHRVETVSTYAQYGTPDQTLISQTVTDADATGQVKTISQNLDGKGAADVTETDTVVVTAGVNTVTSQMTNYGTSLHDTVTTTVTADGLSVVTVMDQDGDTLTDQTRTDVTVVNGAGDRTQTITETNGDGSLRDKTTTVKYADGRSRDIQIDSDGDTHNNQTETIIISAGGVSIDTLTNLSNGQTVLNRTIVTTSADGLSRSTAIDHAGKGVFDLTMTDVLVKNTDGSATETITDINADASIRDRTVTLTSADGLSITTQTDHTGDGTFDRARSDVTVLNADNSKTETINDTGATGILLDSAVITTSADRRSVNILRDLNGDGIKNQIETIYTQLDGSVIDTLINYSPDGSFFTRQVTTTSDNGLLKTMQLDRNGDGVFDQTQTDFTSLNADGSKSETLTNSGETTNQVATNVGGDGLTKTVISDENGDGVAELTSKSVTTLNSDGTRTILVTDKNADGSLRDSSTTSISVSGLTRSTDTDVDGNGSVDITAKDLTVLNQDGSTTETLTHLVGKNQIDQTVTTIEADGRTKNVDYLSTGSVNIHQTESARILGDGSIVDTVSNKDATTGTLLNQTVTATSGNGLSVTTQLDQNGDGTFDVTTTDVTLLQMDGSRQETVTAANQAGSIDSTVTWTSDNGLSKIVSTDMNGDGTFDLVTSDVTVLADNGSTTETVTETNADGSVRDATTTLTSANKKNITITTTIAAVAVETETIFLQTNGSTTDTATYKTAAGLALGSIVTTKTPTGLATTIQGKSTSGTVVESWTDVTVLNADGSQTRTFIETADVNDRVVTTTSNGGFNSVSKISLLGSQRTAGLNASDVTVFNQDGSRVETSIVNNVDGVTDILLSKSSDDELVQIKELDLNGDGTADIADTQVKSVDGSISESFIQRSAATGALIRSETTSISQDGRTTTISGDEDGSGSDEYSEVLTKNADGSTTDTVSSTGIFGAPGYNEIRITAHNPAGGMTVTDTYKDVTNTVTTGGSTTITSANDLDTEASFDVTGNGGVDETRSDVTVLNLDGSQTETITYTYGGSLLKSKQVTTTSDDGLNVTSYYDVDGNGINDRKDVTVINADGSQVETITNYNTVGTQTSQIVRSSYGLQRTVVNGTTTDTYTTFDQANGSYEWTHKVGSAAVSESSMHVIDANGVDEWNVKSSAFTGSVAIDLATEKEYEQEAVNIYAALFSRDMTEDEKELLAKYITVDSATIPGGAFNRTQLIGDLLSSAAGVSKYGSEANSTMDYSAVISAAYKHLFGELPSQATLAYYGNLMHSTPQGDHEIPGLSIGQVVVAIAESFETGLVTRDTVYDGTESSRVWLATAGADTFTGVAGDSVSYGDASSAVVIDLATQTNNAGGATGDKFTTIENVLGSTGNDVITGDTSVNILIAGSGNDTLKGGGGADKLYGGLGNDTYIIDSTNGGTIVENANEGVDTVQSAITYTLGANVENLALTGTTAVNGTGNALDNVLAGNSAANALAGGAGNDTYYIGTGDTVTEAAGAGTDTIYSNITGVYTLAANVENLVLQGTAASTITGNALDNVLDGREIVAVADTFNGGAGNDTYYLGAGDTVTGDTAGTDTIVSGASIDLTALTTIENLTLTGAATGVNGAGNGLANILDGSQNSAANALAGGTGDDTYIVGAGDTVAESVGAGTDTVLSSVSFVLGANIENLTLTGTGNINASGNTSDNTLIGNAGANAFDGGDGTDTVSYATSTAGVTANLVTPTGETGDATGDTYINVENLLGSAFNDSFTGDVNANKLTGGAGDDVLDGGAGADTMIGGVGNDTYVVDDAGDVVTENASEGTDTVNAYINYSIATLANIENVTLFGSALTATGNAGNNILIGNDGVNTLIGGTGNDTLIGGAGGDTLDGTSGTDTVSYATSSVGLTVNLNNASVNTGDAKNDVYLNIDNLVGSAFDDVLSGNSATNAIDGGSGTDTISFADITAAVTVSLVAGTASGTGVGSDTLTNIENVLGGSGADVITGSAGNNRLDGGAGADKLTGGLGDDTYVVDNAGDVVTEAASAGIDTVESAIAYTLGANVENLTLTGTAAIATGNTLDNVITGNDSSNTLRGGAGNDTLDGGVLGTDTAAFSGKSSDYQLIDLGNGKLQVTDLRAGSPDGTDILTNIENLRFDGDTVTGAIIDGKLGNALPAGDNGNETLTGDTGNNAIYAYSGNDTLNGGAGDDLLVGGTGIDAMSGGTGNDTYVVENVADTVIENTGEGTDTVITQVSYTLGANIENLTLVGTGSINGTGNELVNKLTGGAGDDVLDGGAGADTMIGGVGNDTYVVDDAGDVVTENASEGTDTVNAYINYSIATLANIENVTLFGSALTATGNAGNNILIGNDGVNTLIGGTGNDTLIGGAGGDTLDGTSGTDTVSYATSSVGLTVNLNNASVNTGDAKNDVYLNIDNLVGSAFDDVLSGNSATNAIDGGSGTDTISFADITAAVTVSLVAGTASGTGVGSDTLTNIENVLGGSGADVITGSAGNNRLDGGAGADKLTGGLGDDTYVVDNAGDVVTEAASAGIDTVESAIAYTLGANVENLTLTGTAITGAGNALGNTLIGNDADNTLDGNDGDDRLEGGKGNDTLIGDNGNDTLKGGEGDDLITGGAGNDTADGGAGNDVFVLSGKATDYQLTDLGGGVTQVRDLRTTSPDGIDTVTNIETLRFQGDGTDVLLSHMGDDTYTIDNSSQQIYESAGGGIDTVNASISYTLGTNVENLNLTGGSSTNGSGNDLDNKLTGNNAANTLSGGNGNDELDGQGGGDTLIGGAGDDTYHFGTGSGQTEIIDQDQGWTQTSTQTQTTKTLTYSYSYTGYKLQTGEKGGFYYQTDFTGTTSYVAHEYNVTLTPEQFHNNGGNDTVSLGAGISSSSLIFSLVGNDLYVGLNDSSGRPADQMADALRLSDWLNPLDRVENIKFADGSTASIAALVTAAGIPVTAPSPQAVVSGSVNPDAMAGNSGSVLEGGAGNDTYSFGRGGGSQAILDESKQLVTATSTEAYSTTYYQPYSYTYIYDDQGDTTTASGIATFVDNGPRTITTQSYQYSDAGQDTVHFGANIGVEDIALRLSGNDLIVAIRDPNNPDASFSSLTDQLRIENWTDPNSRIETFSFADGTSINVSTLLSVYSGEKTSDALAVQDGSGWLSGGSGNDTLTGAGGNDVLIGGTGNDTLVGGAGADRLYGGVGTDTADYSASLTAVNVSLLTGAANTGGDAQGDILNGIENLVGSVFSDLFTGDGGDNYLNGGGGADTLIGGKGNDTYVIDNIGDAVTESSNEGTDTVLSALTYALGANIENLTLTGTGNINGSGNDLNNVIVGTVGNNVIDGGVGDDLIDGGGGTDSLTGGTGNDTFLFTAAGIGSASTVSGGSGSDLIQFTIAGTVAAAAFANVTGVDVLTLADGTNSISLNDAMVGSSDAALLRVNGGTGADTIDATGVAAGRGLTFNGGAGSDVFKTTASKLTLTTTIVGGAGQDTLTLTTAGTIAATALANVSGIDIITLANGTNNIALSDAIVANSDSQSVKVNGGSGIDTINASAVGAGHSIVFSSVGGPDVLIGGAGGDEFDFASVTSLASTTIVNGGSGIDTIKFFGTGTFASNSFAGVTGVDVISLATGTNNITLTDAVVASSDASSLRINATSGADTINASAVASGHAVTFYGIGSTDTSTGGAGNDTFEYTSFAALGNVTGGAGSDTMKFDNAVNLAATAYATIQGIDNIALASGTNSLVLTDALIGSSDAQFLTVTGNAGADTLNASAVLAGHRVSLNGGLGNDSLTGGAGNDTLDGGGGTDSLTGSGGYDAYIFKSGYGQTSITNSTAGGTTASGELDFGTGITAQNLWFIQSGQDLVIDILGTTDKATIKGWFGANASAKLSEIKTSGGVEIDANVSQLVSSMATYQSASPGFNPTTIGTVMPADTTLQNAVTAAWHS